MDAFRRRPARQPPRDVLAAGGRGVRRREHLRLLALARAAVAETARTRQRAIEGDYFPLSTIGSEPTAFAAYQFHRRAGEARSTADGFAVVFRRPLAPEVTSLKLLALSAAANYSISFFVNYSLAARKEVSGGALLGAGLALPRLRANESVLIEYAELPTPCVSRCL